MDMVNMINTGMYNLPGMADIMNARRTNAESGSVEGTAFEEILSNKKNDCPYQYLAKDGVINYNGVTFVCDTKHNRITLGDVVSDKSKVVNVALPSGGNLVFNVDNLGDLTKAMSMFSPEDRNAIMKAIMMYKKCTEKLQELEDEENSSPEENASDINPDDGLDVSEEMRMQKKEITDEMIARLVENRSELQSDPS